MNFTISIVSHRSGELIAHLLNDLRRVLAEPAQIIITINVPEDESFLAPFADLAITLLRNDTPKGFGANHNQAFRIASGRLFAVVNPDIRLRSSPFERLAQVALTPGVGASAPVVLSPRGTVEDSVRRFPTLARLAVRVLLRKRAPDYQRGAGPEVPIDWAAGMFVVFSSHAFRCVNGFDTRFFMYLEDADICRRLWAQGLSVLLAPDVEVEHDAQHNSHRDVQHLMWHLRSAIRYLTGV